MEKINDLLKRLDNKVPTSIARKLDGLRKMNLSLQKAIEEEKENPTEEAEEKKNEIMLFINDEKEVIEEMLENYIEEKEEVEFELQEEKKRVLAEQKKKEEAKKRLAEEKEKEAEEARKLAEQKQKEEEENKQKAETEKKSGIGWGGLIVGGILLVATGGVINYFAKRR